MEINTKRFLQNLASKASEAADEARLGLESAGRAVAEKYDTARVTYEISRIKAEQDHIFADIGRAVFYMNSGAYEQCSETAVQQQTIDGFLLAAEQKQQEIDALSDRLAELSKSRVCGACKHVCHENDMFCSVCGAKL